MVGIAGEYSGGLLKVSQRNRFFKGDTLNCLEAGRKPYNIIVKRIFSMTGEELECANKAAEDVLVDCGGQEVGRGAYIRREI